MERYKEDWEEARQRWEAWWQGEVLDRVVLQVYAPREKPLPVKPPPPLPEGFPTQDLGWLLAGAWAFWGPEGEWDVEAILGRWESHWAHTFYGGEAFPQIWLNFGPGVLASYLVDHWRFATNTVWFALPEPLDWETIVGLSGKPPTPWWRGTLRWVEALEAKVPWDFLVGMPDLGGVLDVLASLRRTENLLVDLYDAPEEVERAALHLASLWHEIYNDLDARLSRFQSGRGAWMGLWSPRPWYPIQCDFSYMLSPAFFQRFVMPTLQFQCDRLEGAIYHWDGTGQIPHLDALLSIPTLRGIQWTPGAGKPGVDEEVWFPLYRRIQAAGKNLVLLGVRPERLERLLEGLRPEGLLCSVRCRTEAEAKELLRQAQRWTKGRSRCAE